MRSASGLERGAMVPQQAACTKAAAGLPQSTVLRTAANGRAAGLEVRSSRLPHADAAGAGLDAESLEVFGRFADTVGPGDGDEGNGPGIEGGGIEAGAAVGTELDGDVFVLLDADVGIELFGLHRARGDGREALEAGHEGGAFEALHFVQRQGEIGQRVAGEQLVGAELGLLSGDVLGLVAVEADQNGLASFDRSLAGEGEVVGQLDAGGPELLGFPGLAEAGGGHGEEGQDDGDHREHFHQGVAGGGVRPRPGQKRRGVGGPRSHCSDMRTLVVKMR